MSVPEHTIASLRPVELAGERRVPLGGQLGALVPGGGLVRGTVVAVEGPAGAGASTLVLCLIAAATSLGEWAGVVDPDGTFGAVAAGEAGVALDHLAVVRAVERRQWPRVVATLLEGVSLVAATVPPGLGAADARRLSVRARERAAVLVVVAGRWPGAVSLRLSADSSHWAGLGAGSLAGPGFVPGQGIRRLRVTVSGRGAAARPRTADLAWPWAPDTRDAPVPLVVEGSGPAGRVASRGPAQELAS